MTHPFQRLSHSLYECKYPIVFCPKYRYRIFHEEWADYTRQQIESLCRQKDEVEVLELNIQPDHIHLVLSIPPKYAVSTVRGFRSEEHTSELQSHSEPVCRRLLAKTK